MDLLSMLGIEVEEKKLEEKKPAKKTTQKKKSTSSAKKPSESYELPLKIVTGWREPFTIDGSEKLSVTQVKQKVSEMFKEYSVSNMSLRASSDKKTIYIGFRDASILAKGTKNLKGTAECRLGNERLDISAVFDGPDEQEIEVSALSQALGETCPVFKGCSFVFGNDVLVPVFTQPVLTDRKMNFPVNILFFGRGTMQITKEQYAAKFSESGNVWDEADGTVSASALTDLILAQFTDLNPKFTKLLWDETQKMVLVTQKVDEEKVIAAATKETYPTQDITLSVIFQKLPLDPSLFGGKTEVTKEELQAYVSGIFPEYSGDNVEFVYNKEKALIVPILKGSRKGAEQIALDLVTSEKEYERRVNSLAAPFSFLHDGVLYRVESTPVALTVCDQNERGEGWFHLRVPKIPQYVLKALYLFFEQVADAYETEVRVRVFYNSLSGKFELNFPHQEVTNTSVYTLDGEYDYLSETVWPVLDMHSHCRFPAVFSAIDNRNELGNWVFGVIGSFGRTPQLLLRVGTGGNFMAVNTDEVFDMKAVNDAVAEELVSELNDQIQEKLLVVGG